MGCQQICLDFCNVLKVIKHGRQGSAITRISFNICIPLHIVVCKQHTENPRWPCFWKLQAEFIEKNLRYTAQMTW